MPESKDRLEELLLAAFAGRVPEPTYEADNSVPKPVPGSLRERIIERARHHSSELLAERLRQAVDEEGWSVDDLASEAVDCEEDAKRFLTGIGNPYALPPGKLARILFRTKLESTDWKDLLMQALVSGFVGRQPMEGQVWGRTSGLSLSGRSGKLDEGTPMMRDPAQAHRVAAAFIEEVMDEWTKLTGKRKS